MYKVFKIGLTYPESLGLNFFFKKKELFTINVQCGCENNFYFLWPWLLLKVFYLLFISIAFDYEELVLYLKLQKVWMSSNVVYRKMPIVKIPYENYLFKQTTSNNLEPGIVGRFPPCFVLLCFGRMVL